MASESHSSADRHFMRRAQELAARGVGATNPNPAVVCVIVRDGRVVGEGWHRRAGGPHAEAEALALAGASARGGTAYVTLEPCSAHPKRTPPCSPALVAAGIRRVVVALRDPNPLVRGRGIALLRRHGIEVVVGLLAEETSRMNEAFVVSCREGRPFVLLKAAVTLDGRIATANGDSKWITSAALRNEARRLRGRYDALLVGVGTALADNPLLLPRPRPKRPFLRVVLDSRLRLPVGGRLAQTSRVSPVLVFCGPRADAGRRRRLEAAGVEVVAVTGRDRVPVRAVVEELGRRGLRSVMVEGGSEVLGSFLAERLFDKVVLYRAPLVLGGRRSRPAFGGPDPARIADAVRLVPGPTDGAAEVWYPRGFGRR